MTPGALYDALIDALEGVAVTQAHARDVFSAHRGPLAEMPLRDRVFALEFISGVDRVESRMGCNEYHAEFSFTAVYTSTNQIQQRIGNDSKLIYDAIIALIGSEGGDITDAAALTSDITAADERAWFMRRTFDVTFLA